jgi:protein-S-isoprenylcysteine O-methyltransferase Ste14
MEIIPEFKLGLLNGWIYVVLFGLIHLFLSLIFSKEALKRIATEPGKRKSKIIIDILWYISLAYPLFLTIKLNSVLFYIGSSIYLISLVLYFKACADFAATPLDKPVTTGMYRISRNPIHISWLLCWVGLGISTASWLLILITVVMAILMHKNYFIEEKFCLEKYGDDYREYMKKVRRYI